MVSSTERIWNGIWKKNLQATYICSVFFGQFNKLVIFTSSILSVFSWENNSPWSCRATLLGHDKLHVCTTTTWIIPVLYWISVKSSCMLSGKNASSLLNWSLFLWEGINKHSCVLYLSVTLHLWLQCITCCLHLAAFTVWNMFRISWE